MIETCCKVRARRRNLRQNVETLEVILDHPVAVKMMSRVDLIKALEGGSRLSLLR
jgi:hypothetical protein